MGGIFINILSIQLGHNASVLLASDRSGLEIEVLGAISQERFDNIKNSRTFPIEPITWLLNGNRINPKEIDRIVICGFETGLEHIKNSNSSKLKELYCYVDYKHNKTILNKIFKAYASPKQKKVFVDNRKRIESKLRTDLGFANAVIEFVEHHTCHAYTPICFFGAEKDEEILVFTMDGAGDKYFCTVNIYRHGKMELVSGTDWTHSLGYVYGQTTKFLGMKPVEHEYKVMGLAAYSKYEYYKDVYDRVFKDVIWLKNDGSLQFDSKFPLNRFNLYLREVCVGERFDNVAGALQHLTEKIIVEWITAGIKKTGIKNVMTSGGVFMNVKSNMLVQQIKEIERIRFMPTCGDETNPFGAALYVAQQNGSTIAPVNTLYLGHSYTNKDVKKFIEKNILAEKYDIEFYENIEEKIAKLLSEYKVVARVHGAAEFGARSLGNRAILANPSDLKSFYMVNDQVKLRDFWMPFAPSILDTDKDRYIIDDKNIETYYMITGFHTTPLAQEHLKAAMHQSDKTVRPQIVREQDNPSYYKILTYFKNMTGIGGVMNTSYNLHGYPLAEQLGQALFTFENSGLEYLAIENYIVSKKIQIVNN